MRPFGWVLVVVAAGAVCRAADDDAAVRRWVGRLSSPDFQERETASRELDRLCDAALGPLREAANTGDAETRRRATALVERIGRRQAAARILAPTEISLNYDNVPLTAAVADLSRRTGMPMRLHAADSFASRSITLRAEKVTVWQAMQLFCNRAVLHEWDGLSFGSTGIAGGTEPTEGVIVLGQMSARRGQLAAVTAPSPVSGIAFIDGPGPALLAHQTGSVRVRALPGAALPYEATGKDIFLQLYVSAEARLHVDGASDLRIERAIDEHGHERIGRPIWSDPPEPTDDWGGRGRRMPPQLAQRKHGPVAIRFAHDDDPPKRLRELAGVVTVQTFAAEQAVEIAKPVRAVGQTVRGAGVSLSLLSLSRHAGNEVRVTAEVQLPYGTYLDQPVAGPIGIGGRGGGFGRNWVALTIEPEPSAITGTQYQGLSIGDSTGRPFSAAMGATEIVGLFAQHYTVHVTAAFRAPADGAEPARVAFAVRRPTTVEVPFVLRDVPLK